MTAARPRVMRRLLPFLLLLGVVTLPFPQHGAAASCAGPSLDPPAAALTRGTSSTVEGRGFVDGCRDTMSCSSTPGCSSCEYDEPPERPLRGVRLELVQDGRTWLLGTADAGTAEEDRLGHVAWTFTPPADARPGPARLRAGDGVEAEVSIG